MNPTWAVVALAARWNAFLDALLGPRCQTCGERVFPKDREGHGWVNHGDEVAA